MTNNEYRCKLYHKTTWFETLSSVRLVIMVTLVANYITKLRGLKPQIEQSAPQPQDLSCKLYHKTTWFETHILCLIFQSLLLRCKLYHKTTWFETLVQNNAQFAILQVANYITKLRGLKPCNFVTL